MDYAQLADLLDALPWGADGVPEPLAPLLTRAQACPKRSGGLPAGRIEYQLLAALGLSGWSVRADLAQAVNLHKGLRPRSGTYLAAFRRLAQAGLWQTYETSFSQRKLALVRLTPLGWQLLAEVVQGCGVVVDHGDVPAFSKAIGYLAELPQLRAELGRAARAYAEQQLATDVVLGHLEREMVRMVMPERPAVAELP